MSYLSEFAADEAPYRSPQTALLDWLRSAHARTLEPSAQVAFHRVFDRVMKGLGEIQYRSHYSPDATHTNWEKTELFTEATTSMEKRLAVYDRYTSEAFGRWYKNSTELPPEILHVTCTGYIAPNAAEKRVSQLEASTRVTPLYHSGCFAAIPAVREAGFRPHAVDICHTEMCSVHFRPGSCELDQMVIQGLFADGFIRYRSSAEKPQHESFRVLQTEQHILPGTSHMMTWQPGSNGFEMRLSREVPEWIGKSVSGFVDRFNCERGKTYFAIHPGGPRIVDTVCERLALEEWQFSASKKVLREYGNMSSATLPFIWREMLPSLPTGAQVVSLAFGPGLTLSGLLMQKEGGA